MKNFEKPWLNEENKVWIWENIAPNVTGNSNPNYWNALVEMFGPGSPGYSERTTSVRSVDHFGTMAPVDVRWTVYRSDEEEILCIHGNWINDEGYQRPFILMVNPDHQRKGIGTQMMIFLRERFMREYGHDMDADITFHGVKATESGAAFVNKYVNEDYEKRNNNIDT